VSITLFHHPFSRAADVVWMLEEVGHPYELVFVDLMKGEQLEDTHRARNKMSKLPVLDDDGTLISERSAIGLYLADRYAPGRLAPALDAATRGPFLRWCFYASAVIEPGCTAKSAGFEFKPGQAGWGRYAHMLDTLDDGLKNGPYLLGEQFSMADMIVGGTLRWMLLFKMIDAHESYTAYVERLNAREAYRRASDVNQRIIKERGLG
jgi:glutathione S-transferase